MCVRSRCKRKTTRAINAKLVTRIFYGTILVYALTLRSKGQMSRSGGSELCCRRGSACRHDCSGFSLLFSIRNAGDVTYRHRTECGHQTYNIVRVDDVSDAGGVVL